MFGLTPLGAFHTLISVIAIATGFWAFARDREIAPATRLGQLYLAATAITAATGLAIFQHGSFRIGHMFAIATLAAVAVGTLAATTALFGRASRYVQAVFYSSTMLIHMITGSAETLTRLPPGAPLVTAANAYVFPYILWGLVLLFLLGLGLQLRWLRTETRPVRD